MRKSGYYWVQRGLELDWFIAEYHHNEIVQRSFWTISGTFEKFGSGYFDQIDERIIRRKNGKRI